jgi:hypothetical protein
MVTCCYETLWLHVGLVTIFKGLSHRQYKHCHHLAAAAESPVLRMMCLYRGRCCVRYKHGHGVRELAMCCHVQAAVMIVCIACSRAYSCMLRCVLL